MGSASESVSVERDSESRAHAAPTNQLTNATVSANRMDRFVQSSPAESPSTTAQQISKAGPNPTILQRAQRSYGNRMSQQIVMRARSIQRKCDCGGTCAKCQEEEEGRVLQRSSAGPSFSSFDGIPSSQGEPLAAETMQPLEAHFQADLSDVRVHTNTEAAESAAALDAHAYTTGRDIYFAPGMYAPGNSSGQHLLAHEVAHVVQQSSGREPIIAMKSSHGAKIGAPDDPLEVEADHAADTFLQASMPQSDEERRRLSMSSKSYIQRQETPAAAAPPVPDPSTAAAIAEAVFKDDVSAVVVLLRNNPIQQLVTLRTEVLVRTGRLLEHWFVQKLNQSSQQSSLQKWGGLLVPSMGLATAAVSALEGDKPKVAAATAEEGLRWLWRALTLVERIAVYDEGYREIEQAQLDTIKHSTTEERAYANTHDSDRLEKIYDAMDAKEEYQARTLIDPSPAGLLKAAEVMLSETRRWKNKDLLYDAILALSPPVREQFFYDHQEKLHDLLWPQEFETLKALAHATEAGALIARLRLATENRSDDMEAVQAVVDRAVALLGEKQNLVASLSDPRLSPEDRAKIEQRLRELGLLENLMQMPRRESGELDPDSFMGMLSAARNDPDAFAADTAALAPFGSTSKDPSLNFNYQAAKQRLLLAKGDAEATLRAFLSIHAPLVKTTPGESESSIARRQHDADVELRTTLLMNDSDVHSAFTSLVESQQMHVLSSFRGDAFNEALVQLNQYRNTGQWGQFFDLVLKISRNDEWRARYNDTSTDPFGVFAGTFDDEREIMLKILKTHHLPIEALLEYTGSVSTLQAAFADLGEDDRTSLREGWAISHNLVMGPLTPQQLFARDFYLSFEQQVRKKQGSGADFEDVLGAGLGSMATVKEMSTPEGRYNAAALMYARIDARLGLDRGMAAEFTETDETMVAAGREFAALWLRVRDQHALSFVDFSELAELNETFLTRSKEFTEASHAITDLAATIAATVAGIVVVAATGGMALPAVITIAAASGAGVGIVTREMFGGDYYRAASSEARKAMLMDSINGALAVVSGGLAAEGTKLVGLGGKALTAGAARVAGTVAEEATISFGQKVAASAVESAIDGFFSGALSEGFATMMDDANWRKGIWAGLLHAGQAALEAGLTGMATGGLLGAATPVLGKGYSALKAFVTQDIERTLAKAGARDLLDKAFIAARNGDVESTNQLMAKMEDHLTAEQSNALRGDLNAELRQKLGRPPGAPQLSKEERELLSKSGRNDGTLSADELKTETSAVERSEPRISSDPNFVDEVELENGHTWRRKEDGTWCRFSTTPTNCKTAISGAKKISPQATARARRVEASGDRYPIRGKDDPTGRAADIHRLKNTPPLRPAHFTADQEYMWGKYTEYYSKRLNALESGVELEPPRTFESYSNFQGSLRRARQGTGFQAEEAEELIRRMDARTNVGLSKVKNPHIIEGESETKFVDALLKHPEQGQGRVGISFKARAFDDPARLAQQVTDDIEELVEKYGGARYIRRRGPEFGQQVQIDNLILSYEALRIRTIREGTREQMQMFIRMVAEDAAADLSSTYPGLNIAVVFR